MLFNSFKQKYKTIDTLTEVQTKLVDICWQFPNCNACPLSGKFHLENTEIGEIHTYGCLSLFMDGVIDRLYDVKTEHSFEDEFDTEEVEVKWND